MVLEFFNAVNAVLWGPATLLLFMGTGFFLMVPFKMAAFKKGFLCRQAFNTFSGFK